MRERGDWIEVKKELEVWGDCGLVAAVVELGWWWVRRVDGLLRGVERREGILEMYHWKGNR
jgi:predicted GH43/DUF377 family glycosyl hydrolase